MCSCRFLSKGPRGALAIYMVRHLASRAKQRLELLLGVLALPGLLFTRVVNANLGRRSCTNARHPRRHVGKVRDIHTLSSCDPGPRETGDVGNGELTGQVVVTGQARVHYPVEAPSLGRIAARGIDVIDTLLGGMADKVRRLTRHRSMVGYLPEQPGDRFPLSLRIFWQE